MVQMNHAEFGLCRWPHERLLALPLGSTTSMNISGP